MTTTSDSTATAPSVPVSETAPQRPLRFLFVGLPLWGHTNPTLGTVRSLVDAGHQVTYIQDPKFRDAVESAGAQYLRYDDYPDEMTGLKAFVVPARRAFSTALRVGADYDALVYENLFYYGKALADRIGIPAIRLSSTFATSRRIMWDMAMVSTRRSATNIGRGGLSMKLMSWDMRRKKMIDTHDMLTETLENLPKATYVYTTSSFQVEPETLAKGQFHFVGPSVAERVEREDNQGLIDFDSLPGPIIYVSMGTLLTDWGAPKKTAKLYRQCIRAFDGWDASVIVSTGSGVDAETLGPIPSNVHVYPKVPQLEVLRHADLFVTHGGMNSVNEALYYGVPTVVVPMADDQPTVAQRVTELGLGTMIPFKTLTSQVLADQARTVLDDPGVRLLLDKMSRDMQHAGGNERVAREIAGLVRSLQRNDSTHEKKAG